MSKDSAALYQVYARRNVLAKLQDVLDHIKTMEPSDDRNKLETDVENALSVFAPKVEPAPEPTEEPVVTDEPTSEPTPEPTFAPFLSPPELP